MGQSTQIIYSQDWPNKALLGICFRLDHWTQFCTCLFQGVFITRIFSTCVVTHEDSRRLHHCHNRAPTIIYSVLEVLLSWRRLQIYKKYKYGRVHLNLYFKIISSSLLRRVNYNFLIFIAYISIILLTLQSPTHG